MKLEKKLIYLESEVDKINIEGLQRTKDDVVVETVQDLFKAKDFQEVIINAHKVRGKLEKLGCFQNIGIFIDTSTGAEATLDGLEVTFFVKELKRMIGGANTMVGNNEGSLVVSLRAPNMFGRGEKLQAEYSYGSRRTNNLSLSFVKPLRTKYDAMFTSSIFQHGSDWPWSGYRVIERGVLFDLVIKILQLRHNIQYEGAWREMGTSSRSSAFDVRQESGHKIKSALRHILTFDKRDAQIFPSSGTLFRFTTELAGLGGDIKFLKNDFFAQYNFPLIADMVLQATLQAGYLQPLGDGEAVGLPDKFYVGGPMSVRGFETRGVGPRSDGNATGSNVALAGGLHLYTPLPFRPGKGGFGDLFRVHFFLNMGQCKEYEFGNGVTEDVKNILDGYRLSYGCGLALRLGQLARVEFNYVIPLKAQDADVTAEGFQFGVGLQFL
ncbi:sorting and assembly machinery sam50 protein, putative [Pediculus humanus corporis]|uniref:Sorting and assembly machinery sam50 protein, putative n=1 Tax=Pediculus humanus subsp. corporis TaxID=121224 RepID=E0W2M2_PEDHC|nr:sorting and assembly machinery sam50 protein, putative [Pediculus humanus corporis]EEB19878.1 sorting and assembly machinery sam50 protein, putative [Pediculus humanus corporis]